MLIIHMGFLRETIQLLTVYRPCAFIILVSFTQYFRKHCGIAIGVLD